MVGAREGGEGGEAEVAGAEEEDVHGGSLREGGGGIQRGRRGKCLI